MAAANTYTPIFTTTLGSAVSSYTFSSIPSTYTDLVLVVNGASTADNPDVSIQVGNGSVDTATNYSSTYVNGSGSAAQSQRRTSTSSFYVTYYASPNTTAGSWFMKVDLQNYSNTTTYKSFLLRDGDAISHGVQAGVGLWRQTSAIDTIKILNLNSTFIAGSTFTLYGILAA